MAKVYLETSFVSYLVARASRDLIMAARQQITLEWWDKERTNHGLYASEIVLREARQGDPNEIAKRDAILKDLQIIDKHLLQCFLVVLYISQLVVLPFWIERLNGSPHKKGRSFANCCSINLGDALGSHLVKEEKPIQFGKDRLDLSPGCFVATE